MHNLLIENNYIADQALILYRRDKHGSQSWENNTNLVTKHNIYVVDGQPTLGPAEEVTTEFLNALKKVDTATLDFVPPGVVALSHGCAAWVVPGKVRPLALPRIKEFDGVPIAQPDLLFIARGRELWVYALADGTEVTPGTELYYAPYPNMYSNHQMCRGTVPLPPYPDVQNLEEYEDLFFLSNGTHTPNNFSPKIKTYRSLLQLCHKNERFNPEWLKPAGLTLAEALSSKR